MFQKIYIHNYKCFQNFEFDSSISKTLLLLGKNGSGKSSLLKCLTIIRDISKGENSFDRLFSIDDFNDISKPITFSISVNVKDVIYDYSLSVIWSKEFKRIKIYSESLITNKNTHIFTRNSTGEIDFNSSSFILDWHSAALPLLISRNQEEEIVLSTFKNWLSSMILISPVPSLMNSISDTEDSVLQRDAGNFVNWFRGIYTSNPNLYIKIHSYLKDIFNDFNKIELRNVSPYTKKLDLFFVENGKSEKSLKFGLLSDGEKILILMSTLIALTESEESFFCFWDEPDNYISIAIVDSLISLLKGKFERTNNKQLFITSHDEMVVKSFPLSKVYYLYRNSHLEPTRLTQFSQNENIIDYIKFSGE